MIVLFLCAVLVVVFFMHRARRNSTLHGLNGERPVFHVDPPTRRLGDRRRELL